MSSKRCLKTPTIVSRLHQLADQQFYQSLGADRTSYSALTEIQQSRNHVPTEQDTYYRNQLLHGYVHDMGAAMMGGVGGHAGLFANANDVAKIMQMFLQKGFYGGKRYLKPTTIEKFNHRYFSDLHVRRGLGFDKPQLDSRRHGHLWLCFRMRVLGIPDLQEPILGQILLAKLYMFSCPIESIQTWKIEG